MPFDASAFNAPPAQSGGALLPESVTSAPLDCDGNPIMPPWSANDDTIRRYNLQTTAWRARRSREWVESEIQKANAPVRAGPGGGATNYTTQYAIDWVKRQRRASGLSWTVIDRERFVKSPREGQRSFHQDLQLGLDVLADDGEPGMVGIQAAGRNERAVHWQRFIDRSGPEKAKQRRIRVLYLVFERGNKEPIEIENWT